MSVDGGANGALRHFLDLDQIDAGTLRHILDVGRELKEGRHAGPTLAGKTLAMIFEKPSTRTRVSFQVAIQQLGGQAVLLSGEDSQLGRGETVADTARVLSRFVDAIMIRTDDPAKLDELAHYANVPVVNGLTDRTHPCQIMADVMTVEQHKGDIAGKTVAWCGDGNNVLHSWMQAAARFGFRLNAACPEGHEPDNAILEWTRDAGGTVEIGNDPAQAVEGADVVVTDTWISMGQGDDTHGSNVHNTFRPYQVNADLMKKARSDALFMHCLPAHRGDEVTDDVIDGPNSVVWDEAENRLHAQKGILLWSMGA
ncbi:MAG: ornithine carbamoyltransferase [Rhodospirillales bacterium]